jgi:Sec7-like guanine-nucleotide exchange factor
MKSLKKEFKKIMKKNIFLFEKNEYFKIEKLIKYKNGDSFFKKVNEMKKDKKENIDIEMDTLLVL